MKEITLTRGELNELSQVMQNHQEMEEIILTLGELNELLQVMQNHQEIAKTSGISEFTWSFSFGNFTIKQLPLYDFFNCVFKDDKPVLFNIFDKDYKLVFEDDKFIFTFIFCQSDVVRVGTTNGEKIILDDIISK